MTTETDVKQRLDALNAVLAGATKACGCYSGEERIQRKDLGTPYTLDSVEWRKHEVCQGTGEVAKFLDFRQPCLYCNGIDRFRPDCKHCDGTGWQVRAGGMAGALAGLGAYSFAHVMHWLMYWRHDQKAKKIQPSPDTILVKTLELVCKAAGLEVPNG